MFIVVVKGLFVFVYVSLKYGVLIKFIVGILCIY